VQGCVRQFKRKCWHNFCLRKASATVLSVDMRCCWGCSTSYGVDPQPAAAHRLHAAPALHVVCAKYYLRALLPGSGRGSTLLGSFSHSRSLSVLLAAQSRTRVQRIQVQTLCSSNDRQSSNSRRPKRGWPPWKWPEEIPSLSRIAFNVTAFLLLMRIWPLHGRNPLGQAQPVAVQVPFSEFIQQTDSDHVSAVTVDNRSVKYTLRPDAPAFRNIPQKDEAVNVAFQTTRPADYAMPYETLVKQGVQFAAVDSRNSPMLTVLVGLWQSAIIALITVYFCVLCCYHALARSSICILTKLSYINTCFSAIAPCHAQGVTSLAMHTRLMLTHNSNLSNNALNHHLHISSSGSAASNVCMQCWCMQPPQSWTCMPIKCVPWTLPMRPVCHAGICYVHWTSAECTQQASAEAAWQ